MVAVSLFLIIASMNPAPLSSGIRTEHPSLSQRGCQPPPDRYSEPPFPL
jgi:hypothetical protein